MCSFSLGFSRVIFQHWVTRLVLPKFPATAEIRVGILVALRSAPALGRPRAQQRRNSSEPNETRRTNTGSTSRGLLIFFNGYKRSSGRLGIDNQRVDTP